MQRQQQKYYYSGGLHVALLVLAILGLPHLFPDEMPEAIDVVISTKDLPVLERINAPPMHISTIKTEEVGTQAPPVDAPRNHNTARVSPPTPAASSQVKDISMLSQEVEKQQKKENEKDKAEKEFEETLKSIQSSSEVIPQASPSQEVIETTKTYDPAQPMSQDEISAIVNQIGHNWVPPAGVKDDYKLIIHLRVVLDLDGAVRSVTITPEDMAKANTYPEFAAAARAARVAVYKSSPLKNLPIVKYEMWKDIEITFDPSSFY